MLWIHLGDFNDSFNYGQGCRQEGHEHRYSLQATKYSHTGVAQGPMISTFGLANSWPRFSGRGERQGSHATKLDGFKKWQPLLSARLRRALDFFCTKKKRHFCFRRHQNPTTRWKLMKTRVQRWRLIGNLGKIKSKIWWMHRWEKII